MNAAADALLGLLVLAWILWRQTQTREVRLDRGPRAFVVLAGVGLWQIASFLGEHAVRPVAIAVLVGSLVVSAAFGLLRGRVQPVWREADGRVLRRGTAVTITLWLVAVALHLGADEYAKHVDAAAAGLASASLMLYLAVSLGVQTLVVRERATHLVPRAGETCTTAAPALAVTPSAPVPAAPTVAAPAHWPAP